ncbi:efflux RND transporter periplasmic adaptor subunit [Legionella jordanis]|uniref:Membrane fusion protein n=1 Tax=Legionella jordanis TaxID=456 RepID=A0A0W0VCW6_9GAMM|nr:efflux RND transporter periplasmic adaptor subunit [Legionella jordanis]KTD17980.1 membrane fusion protein [Legionella jordanis]RMX02330.1 efflux RND transporter periplasmic adaptor subunit [Legionella jordanis]RMX15790.1 efflux RND transporter periplasmic adaptor subunit [Legionella jordanis]VEH13928.1 Membrane-fusion protein [Legionella jordanis]HAT8714307.1 efflux RND transporter periplasmic adaptor subunit [Legionella jordanis]
MKKLLLLALSTLLFLAAWIGFGFWPRKAIEVVHPIIGTAVQAAYATGTVEPTVMMPISSQVTARLIQLNVDEGSDVKKGQVLAQLEDIDLQETLNEQKEREELAKKRFERNAELIKKGMVSKDEYDRTVSEWKAAIAQVKATEAKISYLKLIAPADGKIIRRDGEIGQLIPANQAVFWLSCCAPLRISTEVDEEDIADVRVGQKVLIQADAFPNKMFYGQVQSITPKGDPIARSYRVRIRLSQQTPLLIGMTAETNIIFHEKTNALLLPLSTLVKNEVWKVEHGRLRKASVVVGTKGLQKIEIIKGASTKDLVVLHPSADLKEGMRVRPVLLDQEKE